MDYNSTRSFTMTLAHRAVGDIRRGGFRQLRNYVDMCATLAKKPQQKDFFAYAQKALQRTDSCYYSMIHRLLDSVEEDRICTVGVNMGFGGLIYGASEMKKQADVDGKPIAWITAARLRRRTPGRYGTQGGKKRQLRLAAGRHSQRPCAGRIAC